MIEADLHFLPWNLVKWHQKVGKYHRVCEYIPKLLTIVTSNLIINFHDLVFYKWNFRDLVEFKS